MLALALALFAFGPVPSNLPLRDLPKEDPDRVADSTLSPITVMGKTDKGAPVSIIIDMPSDDTARGEFVSIWPAKAYRNGTEGRVTLRCRIDVHGLAEVCGVKSESPEGQGFGQAAMQLRPTFRLKPIRGPDGAPVETQVDIAVKFHPPRRELDLENMAKGQDLGGQNPFSRGDPHNNVILTDRIFIGNPTAPHAVTMLNRPIWAAAPGFDDLAEAYPAKAGAEEGYAVAHCQVIVSGELRDCAIVKETPDSLGFAKAALSIVYKFKVIPALASAPHSTPLWVDIPIRMPPPSTIKDRMIASPDWLTDPQTWPNVFPAEAAARGVTSGLGVAQCVVGPDGALTQCAPQPGAPDGLGFSETVAKLVSTLKVALWSMDAGPVYGGKVRVELRLDRSSSE